MGSRSYTDGSGGPPSVTSGATGPSIGAHLTGHTCYEAVYGESLFAMSRDHHGPPYSPPPITSSAAISNNSTATRVVTEVIIPSLVPSAGTHG